MNDSLENKIEPLEIKNENDSKYKNLFDKYKDEDGLIAKNGLNEILNACGIECTIEQSEELIKKINRDNHSQKLNLNQFTELMESDNIIDINHKQTISTIIFILAILILLISGVFLSVTTRKLPKLKSRGVFFGEHKQFPIFCIFSGQAICLLLYFIKSSIIKNNENLTESKKPEFYLQFLKLIILNIIANNLTIFILVYLNKSIQEMFLSNLIVLTFIASAFYLKKKYYRHHILSICLIIIGLTFYGLNDLVNVKPSYDKSRIGIGIFLYILAQIIISFYFSLEEKILKIYYYDPLKLVGLEGLIGTIIYIFLLLLFQAISCDSWANYRKKYFCVKNDKDHYHIEDTIFAFKQIFGKRKILINLIIYLFAVAFYNCSRIIIFKNISSIFYLIIDNLRRILFFIIATLVFKKQFGKIKEYYEEYHWRVLLGLGIFIFGSLIFFEIIIFPCAGFGYNTKKAIKKRQNEQLLNMNMNI